MAVAGLGWISGASGRSWGGRYCRPEQSQSPSNHPPKSPWQRQAGGLVRWIDGDGRAVLGFRQCRAERWRRILSTQRAHRARAIQPPPGGSVAIPSSIPFVCSLRSVQGRRNQHDACERPGGIRNPFRCAGLNFLSPYTEPRWAVVTITETQICRRPPIGRHDPVSCLIVVSLRRRHNRGEHDTAAVDSDRIASLS